MKTNIYAQYQPLMESWHEYTDVVREHIEGYSDVEATQLSILLENTKSELEVSTGRLYQGTPVVEGTDISMIKTFQSQVFDIVTSVMPNLIANDIVSVQPLDRRNGQVFFLKFVYGDTKGGITKGDGMITPQTGLVGADYSGETVSEVVGVWNSVTEKYEVATGDIALLYQPIQAGSVRFENELGAKIGVGSFTVASDGSKVTVGTLIADAGNITLVYEYDLNSFDAKVAQVDVKVESVPVVARPRKLKSIYMFDVAYDLKMSFGLDMDQVIMKATSGEIGYEIDNEIMQDLLKIAGTNSTWNTKPEFKGMEEKMHESTIINAINNASNVILSKTKRYEATFLVCGTKASTVIESMNTHSSQYGPVFKRVSTGGIVGGPHLIGILDEKYKVYKNPYYPENAILVGAKGEMFIESGYIYAPYLPLFASQLLVDADFKAQRGFCTLYAKKAVNEFMYHRLTLVDNVQVAQA